MAGSALKSNITIFVVPFFGGKRPSLKRHMDYFESLGYKTEFIDLPFTPFDIKTSRQNLISFKSSETSELIKLGLRPMWSEVINRSLNAHQGPKIIFSMSNPSAGAIDAIADRNGHDIMGLICDGGPSSNLMNSLLNYYKYEKPVANYIARYGFATFARLAIDHKFDEHTKDSLMKFRQGFRILSIRGWKDPLISPQMIDQVFEPHQQIDWEKLSLPEAEHLNGLKDFPDDYKQGLERFLDSLLL